MYDENRHSAMAGNVCDGRSAAAREEKGLGLTVAFPVASACPPPVPADGGAGTVSSRDRRHSLHPLDTGG